MHSPHETRQWTSVNKARCSTALVAPDIDRESTLENVSESASKHRDSILEAANRLIAAKLVDTPPKKAGLKRGLPAEKLSANKRIKPTSRSKTKSASARAKKSANEQPRKQNYASEPVKRYLLPTKAAKLNELASSSITVKTPRCAVEQGFDSEGKAGNVFEGTLAFCETASDSENQNPTSDLDCTPLGERNSSGDNRDIPVDVALPVIITKRDAGCGMDWDIDDTSFDTSDFNSDDTLVTAQHNSNSVITCDQSMSTFEQTIEFTDNTSSSSLGTISSPQKSSHIASTVEPFLRRTYFNLVPKTQHGAIPRLIPTLRITTCFRIADALRALKDSPETNAPGSRLTIELYAALVDHKTDQNGTQTFKFADLFFSARPPYLIGTGRGLGRLLNILSKPTTPTSDNESSTSNVTICRAIIQQPQGGLQSQSTDIAIFDNKLSPLSHNKTLRSFHIEAIRASTWEEVEHVRGIVDPEGVEEEMKKEKRVSSNDIASIM